MPPDPVPAVTSARPAIAVLAFGNFVVACAVMVVPGMLDQMAADLHVSVPAAGQLLSLAALALCLGAPSLAAVTSRIDRRRLLLLSLLAVGLGHLACALAPDYPVLMALRPLAVLGAAVFTPQGAATIGLLVPPERRATAVTTVFLGWSLASVVAMPMGSLVAAAASWRAAFLLIALLSVLAALAVWRVVPHGLHTPALSLASWQAVARSRRLVLVLAATLTWCCGQFLVLAYVAPSLRQAAGVTTPAMAALLALQGLSGLVGGVLLARRVGRMGPDRASALALGCISTGLLLWSATTQGRLGVPEVALAMTVWGFGSFAFVSAQQARLAVSVPELAPASIALNSASLYLGQALGAAAGGAVVAVAGYGLLGPIAMAVVLAALGLSLLADRHR